MASGSEIRRVALLVLAAIPMAIVINAFRVFLTGFLVYFVSPELGEGFMHLSEGWLLFVIAFRCWVPSWVVAGVNAGRKEAA